MSDRLTIISRPGGFLRLEIAGRYCWRTLPYLRSGNRPDMVSVIIDGTTRPELSDRPVIKLDGSNVSLDNLYISAGNSTVR